MIIMSREIEHLIENLNSRDKKVRLCSLSELMKKWRLEKLISHQKAV